MSKSENMLYSLEDALEVFKDLTFKELTREQMKAIREQFNTSIMFEYEPDEYVFIMSCETFKQFEYYLGMEYERNDIDIKCEINGNVLVQYNIDNERVAKLIDLLESSDKDEE